MSRSSSIDSVSSLGFSQSQESGTSIGRVIFVEENKKYIVNDDATVVSGIVAHNNTFYPDNVPDDFALAVNEEKDKLQGTIENLIVSQELATGFAEIPTEEIGKSISDYVENISNIRVQTTSLSQSSDLTQTSAQSVLNLLITKPIMDTQIAAVLDTTRKREKYTFGVEVIDFTWAKISWMLKSETEILKTNNRFGILKFSCANDIPINGKTSKLLYFQKELEWMLTQDPGAITVKGGTRALRKITVDACIENALALELFDTVYKQMCAENMKYKICAVGGNVLRAFFLSLQIARDWEGSKKTLCDALKKWTPANIRLLGTFAQSLEHLNTLCNKSSDADFTGFEKLNTTEKRQYGPYIQKVLNMLCEGSVKCEGSIEFPLLRLKIRLSVDEKSFEGKCGIIRDKTKTIKSATHFFPSIKWFPQMIPDDNIAKLDELHSKNPVVEPSEYIEIRKLYCVMQEIKKYNALLTTLVADIITEGETPLVKYDKLMSFVILCCNTFAENIKNLKSGVSNDIMQIVQTILPAANNSLLMLLKNRKMMAIFTQVLHHVCNYDKLVEKGIFIIEDAKTGEPMWTKSTSISVGNSVGGISNIQKDAAYNGRTFFNNLPPRNPFRQNLCITVNVLKFIESTKSIEDVKDAEQSQIIDEGGGGVLKGPSDPTLPLGVLKGPSGVSKGGKKTRKQQKSQRYRKSRKYRNRC